MGTPPTARLVPLIHPPARLAAAAFLSGCREAEFAAVRDHCEVSDSVLSKVVATLEEAGYVKVRKGYVGKRPRTWLALTRAGHDALEGHLAALREITDNARAAAATAKGAAPDGREA
jgi:DNA-binding MarR family transcriptional regulator